MIGIINVVLTAAAFLVLTWYTWETRKLRMEAARQNEASFLPILVLELPVPEAAAETDDVLVRNVGRGPAFRVTANPSLDEELTVRFGEVPLLESGGRAPLPMELLERQERVSHQPGTTGLARFIEEGRLPGEFTIALQYEDLARKPWEALYDVAFHPVSREFKLKYRGLNGRR
jgi:hypothetical protein